MATKQTDTNSAYIIIPDTYQDKNDPNEHSNINQQHHPEESINDYLSDGQSDSSLPEYLDLDFYIPDTDSDLETITEEVEYIHDSDAINLIKMGKDLYTSHILTIQDTSFDSIYNKILNKEFTFQSPRSKDASLVFKACSNNNLNLTNSGRIKSVSDYEIEICIADMSEVINCCRDIFFNSITVCKELIPDFQYTKHGNYHNIANIMAQHLPKSFTINKIPKNNIYGLKEIITNIEDCSGEKLKNISESMENVINNYTEITNIIAQNRLLLKNITNSLPCDIEEFIINKEKLVKMSDEKIKEEKRDMIRRKIEKLKEKKFLLLQELKNI